MKRREFLDRMKLGLGAAVLPIGQKRSGSELAGARANVQLNGA